MYKHDYSKHLTNSARIAVALCTLVALGGRVAQAQVNQLTTLSQLGPGASKTSQFSTGDVNGDIPSPYVLPSFGTTVTFASIPEPTSATAFESFINQPNPITQLPALDTNAFPFGTHVIDTFDRLTLKPTGPLEIDFSSGVSAFGLFGQSAASDTYHFSFNVFGGPNGAILLGSFTTPDVLNTSGSGPTQGGNATFIGAQALAGNLITRVVLSDTTTAPTATNDFYFGPLSYQFSSPVPEASTMVGFGMGTFLFAGLILAAHKRKVNTSQQATQQIIG